PPPFPYTTLFRSSSSATRTLAGAGVGASPLTTHGQAAAVTHAAIGSQIDQTLDRELHFTAQVAFDCEAADLFANALEFGVGEVFHFLGIFDTGGFADFASASARSEEHTSELQSRENLVCRLLLDKKNRRKRY